MSDFVAALDALGLLVTIKAVVIALSSIAVYFGFIRKA